MTKKTFHIILKFLLIVFLTILTQIGGIVYLISIFLAPRITWKSRFKPSLVFIFTYSLFTFVLIPFTAPFFGREKLQNSEKIRPANIITILLNRNYVQPELNQLLESVEKKLNKSGSSITISYLDANFPFINNFPLPPHLSHDDGKKLDLSLIYETPEGIITDQQKSISGYGIFEKPKSNETNQIQTCLNQGYFQYDYPKYLTFGKINDHLKFSEKGTKKLLLAILSNNRIEKIFIEPHLKERLNLTNPKIRYHGCRAVRHDDHIHIQIK